MSTSEGMESLPDTAIPRASMIRAIPDMPAPPMPAKCTRPSWVSGSTPSVPPVTAAAPAGAAARGPLTGHP